MAEIIPLDIGRNFVAGQQIKDQRERSKLHDLITVNESNRRAQLNDLELEHKKQVMDQETFRNDLQGLGLLGAAIKNAESEEDAEKIFNFVVPKLRENGFGGITESGV